MPAVAPATKSIHRARTEFRLSPEAAAIPQDHRQKGVADFGPERRREVRYPTCDAVEVAALDVAGFQVRGVLRDVSRNGLCVELGLPVDPGARLKITLRDETIILVAVCYCRKTASSYQVGTAIKGVYQSSKLTAAAPRKVHCNIWRVEPNAGGSGNPHQSHGNPHQSHELARAIVNDAMLFAGNAALGLPAPISEARV